MFWQTLLLKPLVNILAVLYIVSGHSLGLAILLFTVLIRTLLLPVMLPSARNMRKQKELQPEIDKIKRKFKYDKQKQAEMQMELFKKHGINPASGCLTQVVTLLVLFALYGVIRIFTLSDVSAVNSYIFLDALKLPTDVSINTKFLYMDLAKPDPYFVLAVLAGVFQFLSSRIAMSSVSKGEALAKKTPELGDDMAYNMQRQMLYTMPIMSVIVGLTLPSGVVLYMLVTSIFSLFQNYLLYGSKRKPVLDKK